MSKQIYRKNKNIKNVLMGSGKYWEKKIEEFVVGRGREEYGNNNNNEKNNGRKINGKKLK